MSLMCDECEKRPVTVHITKIINGEKSTIKLCEDCARNYQEKLGQWSLGLGIEPTFSFHKFLANLFDANSAPGVTTENKNGLQCPVCGLTYTEFNEAGKLGCGRCYEYFSSALEPLIRRIHGNVRHTGKVPQRMAGGLKVKRELERLRAELGGLIAREEFEKAAEVRDRIRELEKRLPS